MWLAAAGAFVPVAAVAVLITSAGTHPAASPGAKPLSYGTTGSAGPAATSTNWAGYAAAGQVGTFTSVSSSWTQPAVTCGPQQTFSNFWVGLDGDGTQGVERTGTEADCSRGAAAYQGWEEMLPAAPVFYNEPVKPGDAMSASVTANGGGAFTLTLSDQTENWSQTSQQTSQTAQLGSAEVIAEAPSSQDGLLPLSNFGTVNFTNAEADYAPIGNADPASLTMVAANHTTKATPSALTGGNAFAVTFGAGGAATSGGSLAPSGSTAPSGPSPASTAPATPGSPSPNPTATGHRHHHHWSW